MADKPVSVDEFFKKQEALEFERKKLIEDLLTKRKEIDYQLKQLGHVEKPKGGRPLSEIAKVF